MIRYHGTKILLDVVSYSISNDYIIRLGFALLSLVILYFLFVKLLMCLVVKCRSSDPKISISDRMMFYENKSQDIQYITEDMTYLLRLKGRNFSNFVSSDNNNSPYSKNIKNMMILTATDLVKEFKCSTAYVQNDEIILIFDKGSQLFGGNVNKLITTVSSYSSMSFNYHLNKKSMINTTTNTTTDKEKHQSYVYVEEGVKRGFEIADLLCEINMNKRTGLTFDCKLIHFPEEIKHSKTLFFGLKAHSHNFVAQWSGSI